jgi:hypothetical protein
VRLGKGKRGEGGKGPHIEGLTSHTLPSPPLLADYRAWVELEPSDRRAKSELERVEGLVKARDEALKSEMLGKLKDLGNSLLGKFGLSLDNFKAVQDPATGSYSINFQR